ncbi:hypothetical protein D3C84_1066930 [compost metagenome]
MLVAHGDVVAGFDGDGFGDTAGHDEAARRQFPALGTEHVGQHGHALCRVTEYCGAGTRSDYFAVLLKHHAQAFEVDALQVAHLPAGNEAC